MRFEQHQDIAARRGDYRLSEREKEILKLMIDGLTTKIIAENQSLGSFAIDMHIKNTYTKL